MNEAWTRMLFVLRQEGLLLSDPVNAQLTGLQIHAIAIRRWQEWGIWHAIPNDGWHLVDPEDLEGEEWKL